MMSSISLRILIAVMKLAVNAIKVKIYIADCGIDEGLGPPAARCAAANPHSASVSRSIQGANAALALLARLWGMREESCDEQDRTYMGPCLTTMV